MKLVFEEPVWYVNACRIFDEDKKFVAGFSDKEFGREIVKLYNESQKVNEPIEESVLSPDKLYIGLRVGVNQTFTIKSVKGDKCICYLEGGDPTQEIEFSITGIKLLDR